MSTFYQDIEGVVFDFDGVFWPLSFAPDVDRYNIFAHASADTIIELSGTTDTREVIAQEKLSIYLMHGERAHDVLCDKYGINKTEFQISYNRRAHQNFKAQDGYSDIPCLKQAFIELQRSPLKYGVLSHGHKNEYIVPYFQDKKLAPYVDRHMILGKGEIGDYSKAEGPQAYIMMFAILGIDPRKLLMIEDSPRNLVWAKNLGMKTLWIHDGHPETLDPKYDQYIDEKADTLSNVLRDVNAVHAPQPQFAQREICRAPF